MIQKTLSELLGWLSWLLAGFATDAFFPIHRNWSNGRKSLLMVMLQLLTFTVYVS